MSTRISTNIDSLRGLLALQQSSAQQSQALERLSTGTQINSAADNPSGLIQSNALGLQISAINQSITNSNLADVLRHGRRRLVASRHTAHPDSLAWCSRA